MIKPTAIRDRGIRRKMFPKKNKVLLPKTLIKPAELSPARVGKVVKKIGMIFFHSGRVYLRIWPP
jgi:hypothetical protein